MILHHKSYTLIHDQEEQNYYNGIFKKKTYTSKAEDYISHEPLYLYEQITTVWVKTTSVIYIFFDRFHYHSFILCFFFYLLSLIIHNAHDIITSNIIHKTDTDKTDTKQDDFQVFFTDHHNHLTL